MARGTRHRFTVILLIAVLSLASLGFSYTLWAEDLSVAGTITTGEVDAQWMEPVTNQCEERHTNPDNPKPGLLYSPYEGEYLGKDVGSVSVHYDPNDPTMQTLIIEIDGAYPYYAVDCEFKYMNTGTIPWHIEGVNIEATSANLHDEPCTFSPAQGPSGAPVLTMICDEILVTITDGVTRQIHPCSEDANTCWVPTNLFIQVLQPAEEGATYTFSSGVCVGQYNEDPTPGECFAAAP